MAEAGRWQDDPSRVRALVAAAGLLVLLALSGILWLRRVDPVEVAATLLFVPLFLSVLLWRLPGGIIAGVAATGAYLVMRWPAIDTVGLDAYLGLVVGRGFAYLAFGVAGGWAVARLQRSLTKLDLYDQIDDDTGLFNARFLVDGIELERSRAERYRTLFSTVVLEIPGAVLADASARQRRRKLRTLGGFVRNSIRTVDRAVHLADGGRHRLVLLLPETPNEGAAVFAERFRVGVAEAAAGEGLALTPDDLTVTSWTVPGDEEQVDALRAEVARLLE